MLVGWRQPLLLRLCRMRVLVWVGIISYGLYLLHLPALVISRRWLAPLLGIAPGGSAAFFVMIALAIAMAWISWAFFESPILRLRERFVWR
jgi:peptidoglycan/LPS O-acetylase OafA/YrhL